MIAIAKHCLDEVEEITVSKENKEQNTDSKVSQAAETDYIL